MREQVEALRSENKTMKVELQSLKFQMETIYKNMGLGSTPYSI